MLHCRYIWILGFGLSSIEFPIGNSLYCGNIIGSIWELQSRCAASKNAHHYNRVDLALFLDTTLSSEYLTHTQIKLLRTVLYFNIFITYGTKSHTLTIPASHVMHSFHQLFISTIVRSTRRHIVAKCRNNLKVGQVYLPFKDLSNYYYYYLFNSLYFRTLSRHNVNIPLSTVSIFWQSALFQISTKTNNQKFLNHKIRKKLREQSVGKIFLNLKTSIV